MLLSSMTTSLSLQSPCVTAVPAGKIGHIILLTSRNPTLAARVTVLFAVEAQAGAGADGQISEENS